MNILIFDTNSYDINFNGGKIVNNPFYLNNGYGFCVEPNDENNNLAKEHYIKCVSKDLNRIEETIKFYENTKADISFYQEQLELINKKITFFESLPADKFLKPTPTSIKFTGSEFYLEGIKERFIKYCENNNIHIYNIRNHDIIIKSDRTDIKVEVKEHNGRLFIKTLNTEEEDFDFTPNELNNIGCILNNNSRLGISKEAIELIKKVKKSNDAIGDLCGDEDTFSWIGNRVTYLPSNPVGSRYFKVPNNFTYISNDIEEYDLDMLTKLNNIEHININTYDNTKFNIWIELIKKGSTYSVNLDIHDKYIFNDKGDISDTLKVKDDDFNDILDILFCEKLGLDLKVINKNDFSDRLSLIIGSRNIKGYKYQFNESDILKYINVFFENGFFNNIMNPTMDYFRMSFDGTVEEIKNKLSNLDFEECLG